MLIKGAVSQLEKQLFQTVHVAFKIYEISTVVQKSDIQIAMFPLHICIFIVQEDISQSLKILR